MNGQRRAEKEIEQKPGRDDVHEQRSPAQPREGVVPKKDVPRPPTQTETDRDRADWEGMGQPQSKPGA